jgi:hypothetical protein
MDKLIAEEVEGFKEIPLSKNDLLTLKGVLRIRLRNVLISYIGCISAFLYVKIFGYNSLGPRRYGRWTTRTEAIEQFYANLPWVLGFLFLLFTVIFIRYYLQEIHPVYKDIKKGTKLMLSLKLEKREPFFNRYFIYVPLQKNRQLELSGEDYFKLTDGNVKLVVGPSSLFILQLLNGNDKISFHQHKKY